MNIERRATPGAIFIAIMIIVMIGYGVWGWVFG